MQRDADIPALLLQLGVRQGRAALLEHLNSSSSSDSTGAASAAATLLLRQPQTQLRALGLLAARLGGRADLLLDAFSHPGVWKQAATLLCQMDVDAAATARLLRWLLSDDTPPLQRADFLTRLGRLPPRVLGAALFSGLREVGRAQDALRLLRHAGLSGLSDVELLALVQPLLVGKQGAAARVPTWARRAWKALAVQRPELCLQLLKELVAKVRGGDDAPSASSGCGSRTYCPVLMLRRAVVTLLHGRIGREAAAALLLSEEQMRDAAGSVPQSPINPLVLRKEGRRGRLFAWYHVRQQAQRLQEGAASEDAAAAAASAVWTVVMVAEGKAAARWVHRLQRRGVLQRLLETHLVPYLGSEGGREGASGPPLPCSSFGDISKRLLRMACLLTPPGSAQRAALLRSMAAAAVAASIKEVLAYLGARQQGLGDYRVGSPWSLWLYGPGLELWQVDVLAEGVEQLLRSCRSGSGRSTAEAEAKARVLEQLRGYLLWEPDHRSSLLSALKNQSVGEKRAEAYRALLQGVPPTNAAAVNDAVPWVLSRTRNERSFVRAEVLLSLPGRGRCYGWAPVSLPRGGFHSSYSSCPGLLARLSDEHVPLLETSLAGALAAPDADEELQRSVAGVASEMLWQGVLRPDSAMLPAALRLHADQLRRYYPPAAVAEPSSGGVAGGRGDGRSKLLALLKQRARSWWDPAVAQAPAVLPQTLAASTDAAAAVRALLAELLPLYGAAGWQGPRAAQSLLRALTAGSMGDSVDLRCVGELETAVRQLLQKQFPGSDWSDCGTTPAASTGRLSGGNATGEAVVGATAAAAGEPTPGAEEEEGAGEGGCVDSCVRWWLCTPDEAQNLERAKALLTPPGGDAAWKAFLGSELCGGWLLWDESHQAALWLQGLLLSHRPMLQALAEQRPELCRQLLAQKEGSAGVGAGLAQALVREELLCKQLLGVAPAYDSFGLAKLLSSWQQESEEERMAGMEAALAGYVGGTDTLDSIQGYFDASRKLLSTNYRRWPPATQAQLKQLCTTVAGATQARPGVRVAAVCLLARLQDVTAADLALLVGEDELAAACLLVAPKLADKQEAARFLVTKLSGDTATHAASALRRVLPFLGSAEFQELCGDLLATVGLRAASWQQVVMALGQRGGDKALELLYSEMRRPDLTPSMRSGLLKATGALLSEPGVVAFWEESALLSQSAGLPDEQVGADIIANADTDLLMDSEEVHCWWIGLVLGMLKRATAAPDPQLLHHWAAELACSLQLCACWARPEALDRLAGPLFEMAASAPAPGWDAAIWLLNRLLKGASSSQSGASESSSGMRRHLQTLLDRAASEFPTGTTSTSTPTPTPPPSSSSCAGGPSTHLLKLLLEGSGSRAGPRGSSSGLPSPWEAGCTVSPVLLVPLWGPYCSYVAAHLMAEERLTGPTGPADLAQALEVGLAAAPTSAHVLQLAGAMLKASGGAQAAGLQAMRWSCFGGRSGAAAGKLQREQGQAPAVQFAEALLRAEQAIMSAAKRRSADEEGKEVEQEMTAGVATNAQQQQAAAGHMAAGCGEAAAGRTLLAAGLTIAGWLTVKGKEGCEQLKEGLLCTLRRHMAADCGLVSLLLEQGPMQAGRGTGRAYYEEYSPYGPAAERGLTAELAELSALAVGGADVEAVRRTAAACGAAARPVAAAYRKQAERRRRAQFESQQQRSQRYSFAVGLRGRGIRGRGRGRGGY